MQSRTNELKWFNMQSRKGNLKKRSDHICEVQSYNIKKKK